MLGHARAFARVSACVCAWVCIVVKGKGRKEMMSREMRTFFLKYLKFLVYIFNICILFFKTVFGVVVLSF